MSSIRHRVMVQLVDVDEEDIDNNLGLRLVDSMNVTKRFPFHNLLRLNSVEIMDEQTLLVDIENPHGTSQSPKTLHFDCVGRRTDPSNRVEVSSIVEKFLIYCSNICIISFCRVKENQLSFVSNLLMNELEKRVQMMHINFQSIVFEYYDIHKYDVVNLLTEDKKRRREKRKERSSCKFSNIVELHKWLQSDYIQLWNNVLGHDCMDFRFVFLDAAHRLQKIKLSLFFLYLCEMDVDTRMNLMTFFDSLGSEKRIKQNLLTDCLKEYFQGQDKWRTLSIFHLPVSKNRGGKVTDDVLKLATSAYRGLHESIKLLNLNYTKSCSFFYKDPQSLSTLTLSNKTRRIKSNTSNTSHTRSTHSQKTEKRCIENVCTGEDFMSLSQWYTKIDDHYMKVIQALDDFYKLKSDWNISKLCCDIKEMMNSLDQGLYSTDEQAKSVDSNWDHDLLLSYNNYKSCVTAFRNLGKEVEQSQFKELLKIYLKAKSFDLGQHAIRFKLKHLENCQSRLSNAITDEMIELGSVEKV